MKVILSDIDLVVGEGTGNRVLRCIKNTMSDRHIVEKKFNYLLENYWAEILPKVIIDWDLLSIKEQSSLSSLNNFFCGMHIIVGMADAPSSTLLQ